MAYGRRPRKGLAIGIVGVNDELERASVAQPNGREVPNVSRRQATNAEIFSEHHDRRVDEAQAKVVVSPVNVHRAGELIERRCCVRERTTRKIIHERLHRRPLVTKEIIDLRQHQPWNVPRPRSIDGAPEVLMIWHVFDEVVEERAGIADQSRGATAGHRTARARYPVRTTSE